MSAAPTTGTPARPARGPVRYAAAVCVLALVAAVLTFARGSWLGVLWLLIAGLSSNMAWYYVRRSRAAARAREAAGAAATPRA